MDVKNTHSVTKTEISVFGRQALGAERRRYPSLAGKVLKDRDYDVTSYIILILSLTLTQNGRGGVGECLRGVLWIWSAKSAR